MRFLWSPIDPLITAAYLLSKCLQGKLVPGTYLKSAFKDEIKISAHKTFNDSDTPLHSNGEHTQAKRCSSKQHLNVPGKQWGLGALLRCKAAGVVFEP